MRSKVANRRTHPIKSKAGGPNDIKSKGMKKQKRWQNDSALGFKYEPEEKADKIKQNRS